jgi:hypothetical protein
MRILFVMLHPGFIRYYDGALRALAAGGHEVQLAFEVSRDKLGESELARRLVESSGRITCGTAPVRTESVRDFLARSDRSAVRTAEGRGVVDRAHRREERWDSLATTVRLMLDYLRFFEPAFLHANRLRDRAEKRLPRVYGPLVRAVASAGAAARATFASLLHAMERMIPTPAAIDAFIRGAQPDLVLVTPLVELGSQQVDYVKAARHLGVRSAHCVASWDNLTSKGLIRVVPDHVVVWNEAQKTEAVALHGVPPDRVVVTGAQVFDDWFDARPSRLRREFCRDVGLDPGHPFVLYVGSSTFIAPDEVPFAERWIAHLRRSGDPFLASAGVLVRPHPANSRQWRTFDVSAWPNVALWPPIGSDPNGPEARRDYVDSLFHSAAVVGINTSAQLEAGIVGRPVFTIQLPEFAHSQTGTLHFEHLVNQASGVVHASTTLDEHVEQLARALHGRSDAAELNARFVRSFIRPFGADVPAVPAFVRAIESLGAMPAPPAQGDSSWIAAGRPLAYAAAVMARVLAEDRPLWVYALRPFVMLWVWSTAAAYWVRTSTRESLQLRAKRLRRGLHRVSYEVPRAAGRTWRRAQKQARRMFAAAHGADRRG